MGDAEHAAPSGRAPPDSSLSRALQEVGPSSEFDQATSSRDRADGEQAHVPKKAV